MGKIVSSKFFSYTQLLINLKERNLITQTFSKTLQTDYLKRDANYHLLVL